MLSSSSTSDPSAMRRLIVHFLRTPHSQESTQRSTSRITRSLKNSSWYPTSDMRFSMHPALQQLMMTRRRLRLLQTTCSRSARTLKISRLRQRQERLPEPFTIRALFQFPRARWFPHLRNGHTALHAKRARWASSTLRNTAIS